MLYVPAPNAGPSVTDTPLLNPATVLTVNAVVNEVVSLPRRPV